MAIIAVLAVLSQNCALPLLGKPSIAQKSIIRQLVKHIFVDPQIGSGEVAPVLRWSPDGKWIIYHRCDEYDCFVNENTIYKVSVADGQEEKIIDGGGFPSWKP